MIKLKDIRKRNGHTNCHTKNARTRPDRLVGTSRQHNSRTYLYESGKGQNTKVSRRLGIRRTQKERNIQRTLEHQMAICKRQLQRVERLCMVQTNEPTLTFRKRFLERRYLRLRRKTN